MSIMILWTRRRRCATIRQRNQGDRSELKSPIHVRFRQSERLPQPRGDPGDRKRTGVKFEYIPILLGGIFKATNNKSPAETLAGVKNKREFHALETERFVKRFQVKPYVWNPFFPINTLNLMRAAVAAQSGGVFEKYVAAAFHHMWREAQKMDDPEVARKAFTASGLDAAKLFARAQEADVKAKLIENTQAAVERGAFGSPTFFVDKEMFFGKEQLREVEELVSGK